MLLLVYRNLLRRKARTTLTLLGVASMVALTALMFFGAGKDLLSRHPEIHLPPPTGYDPLAPIRQVKGSLPILEQMLLAKAQRELKGQH